eukprot:m.44546 g.44546  ORF g.44546 m.44546 type:complete len:180 (-) comp11716_c0_seq1:554-1093(-)
MSSVRQEMVETAVRFLHNPKVQGSPVSKQTAFLENKGLTAEEISAAYARVATDGTDGNPLPAATSATSPRFSWTELAAGTIVVGGLAYATVTGIQKYVLPGLGGLWGAKVDEEEEADGAPTTSSALQKLQESMTQNQEALDLLQQKNSDQHARATWVVAEVGFGDGQPCQHAIAQGRAC